MLCTWPAFSIYLVKPLSQARLLSDISLSFKVPYSTHLLLAQAIELEHSSSLVQESPSTVLIYWQLCEEESQ